MSQQKSKYFTKHDGLRNWRLIDAEGKILGRLAVEIANALRGKDKPEFTPNQDCGDFVVVINADKVKVTGKKEEEKIYSRHTGYIGGHKKETLNHLRNRRPTEVLKRAVWGMLPKNRMRAKLITKLKLFAGAEHTHEAQLKGEAVEA